MDPFSIATGVAGLLSLVIQLSQITIAYTSSVSGASRSVNELQLELKSLQHVLEQLKSFLERQPNLGPFKDTSALLATNSFCQTKLEALLAKLEHLNKGGKIRMLLRALKWPMNEVENREFVIELHRCTQIFGLSLTVQGWYVTHFRPNARATV
jgi:Fungal N-terminal domain of STAND proteins